MIPATGAPGHRARRHDGSNGLRMNGSSSPCSRREPPSRELPKGRVATLVGLGVGNIRCDARGCAIMSVRDPVVGVGHATQRARHWTRESRVARGRQSPFPGIIAHIGIDLASGLLAA
jgi:hypothetical protein